MPRPAALPSVNVLSAAALLAAGAGVTAALDHHDEAGLEGPYRTAVIDVGVIVSDIEKAEEFYEDALGFSEVDEFDVSAEVAGDSGLTDYKKFTADVMAIGDGKNATKIKLIEIPDAPGARQDTRFIHSTYGPSYLTLHVDDVDAILEMAAKEGVKPLKKGPTKVGGEIYIALLRDPDGNFIELVGPRPNAAGERLEDAADEVTDAADEIGDAAEAVGDAVEDAVTPGVNPGVIDEAPPRD